MKTCRESGFTLVEVLVAMGIFAVLSTAIVSSLTSTTQSFANRRVESETQQDRRTVAQVLTRSLREAGFDPHGTANAGIERALPNRITFSRDLNLNGVLDPGEQETYVFDAANGTLTRRVGNTTAGPGSVIASSLSDVTFTYWDRNDDDLGVPDIDPISLSAIRAMNIDITTVGTRVGAAGDIERTMTLRIACKNLEE